MKHFIENIFRFLFFFLILSSLHIISVISLVGIENIPALNFTDSYSFNEKILFIKKHSINPEIVSIGSSMTQNNLDSEVILAEFQTTKYLNTASWGMKMQDNFNFLKLLYSIYPLDKIIIVSNVVDFQQGNKRMDSDFINYYLTNNNLGTSYSFMKNFNLSYYSENLKYAEYVRNCNNDYQYLGYDQYGMVKFKNVGFNIKEKRWLDNHFDKEISEIEYVYLDSISKFCNENNLKLYFFQSPYREGLFSEFNPAEMNIYNNHSSRLDSILKDKHHFVNSSKDIWNDSLFVDGIHFNDFGAELFTKYCFDKINETQITNSIYIK